MKNLTKAEEEIMQILWELNSAYVKDIIKRLPVPKPAYNTVSTIVRILEKKGFVAHKAYGKTYKYFPLVSKREYRKNHFKSFVENYFGNSYKTLTSFFTKEENLSLEELEEIRKLIDNEIERKKGN